MSCKSITDQLAARLGEDPKDIKGAEDAGRTARLVDPYERNPYLGWGGELTRAWDRGWRREADRIKHIERLRRCVETIRTGVRYEQTQNA